jgi:hypothetical protein
MVDRQIFKDERKRPTEHLVALNHSVRCVAAVLLGLGLLVRLSFRVEFAA